MNPQPSTFVMTPRLCLIRTERAWLSDDSAQELSHANYMRAMSTLKSQTFLDQMGKEFVTYHWERGDGKHCPIPTLTRLFTSNVLRYLVLQGYVFHQNEDLKAPGTAAVSSESFWAKNKRLFQITFDRIV